LRVFEFGILGLVVSECAYTNTTHVLFESTTGPALCKLAASVVSALASVLSGIDVLASGVDVFGTCVEHLRWAVTDQNQSSCIMANILWLDVQHLYRSARFSEAGSGKSGRRASVLRALLSAYLRPVDFMRRS